MTIVADPSTRTRLRAAVYGASGRTGRLVTEALLEAGVKPVLLGRSQSRLSSVNDSLPVFEVAARRADLVPLLQEFDVIVNCAPAGPTFPELIAACLDTGTHFVDGAGEQDHLRRLFDDVDVRAIAAGIRILPAHGFDYVLGDSLAVHTAEACPTPPVELRLAYAISGSGVASGSVEFASQTEGGGEVEYFDGEWRPVRNRVQRAALEFPAPFGRQPVTRYGSGEVITVPRQIDIERIETVITSRSLVPHRVLLPFFPWLRPAVTALRTRSSGRAVLGLAGRLLAAASSAAPEDAREPSQALSADRSGDRFAICCRVVSREGHVDSALTGSDFHGLTARLLAWGALRTLDPALPYGVIEPARVTPPDSLFPLLQTWGVDWTPPEQGLDTRAPRPGK